MFSVKSLNGQAKVGGFVSHAGLTNVSKLREAEV